MSSELDGVVVTGVYGAGKSTVAAEIGDQLETQGAAYAALDLDWLGWFDTGAIDQADVAERVFLANVAAVVGNYLEVGVERFVFAGWIGHRRELDALAAAVPVPLRVVRLERAGRGDREAAARRSDGGAAP